MKQDEVVIWGWKRVYMVSFKPLTKQHFMFNKD